jgi:transposase
MKRYGKEFKAEAVRLSDEIRVKKAAAQLGLPYYTLADWRQQRKEHERKSAPLNDQEARKLIEQLERENRELREANEILKDALGFFAKDRKK